MTHSQNNEEAIILNHVKHLQGDLAVLDIGAYDGTTYSNSLALINMGWRGVLIEPSPTAFLKLLELHGKNPRVQLINGAMGAESNLVKFYHCPENLSSTTSATLMQVWSAAGFAYTAYSVPQITPAMLVNQVAGGYDVISIDTEGTSFDILRALPIGAWTPTVICIEHDDRMVEIAKWAMAQEFDICGLNTENLLLLKK